MNTYRYIPLFQKKLRYLPAIKENNGIWVYIPTTLPADPDTDQDQEPIIPEDA